MINVEELEKTFRVTERHSGFAGTIQSFFAPQYRLIKAVNHISFHIGEGEIVGYLGPNGAGKSTTLKMLTGILVPSGGNIEVNGMVPWKKRTAYVKQIGAVFGQRTTLWWDLPVIDSLDLLRSIYRVPIDRYKETLSGFIDMLDMGSFINSPVRSLSLGQIMRVDLCAAMLHEPQLLFLDEPTIGLDVVAKEKIRQFIKQVNYEKKTTVILTTHDLSDVEKLCERVIIIDQGRKLFDGKLNDLVQRFDDTKVVTVTYADDYDDVSVPGIPDVSRTGRRVTYTFPGKIMNTSELVQQLLSKYQIVDMEINHTELEGVIRKIYEHKLLEPS